MKVTSNIIATEAEIEKLGGSLTQLTSDLTLPNPEYENTLRFGKGRFHRQVDKYICYLKQVGKEYIIPRYYFGNIEGGIRGREFLASGTICPFKLRDYQQEFIKENLKELYDNTGVLLEAPCGSGKCHGKGTRIRMFDGSIKNVEDVVVGDLLMGDDSTPRRVLSLARGREEMFVVHQTKGEDYTVNKSHILTLQYRPWGSKEAIKNRNVKAYVNYGKTFDVPLEDYLEATKTTKSHYYGFCTPIEYSEKPISIPAYLLGLWLGDGSSRGTSFTCDVKDKPLITYYYEIADQWGLRVRVESQVNRHNASSTYHLVGKSRGNDGHFINALRQEFQRLNLLQNKHIPDDYLHNSRQVRLEFLAGLIDTDGYVNGKTVEITQKRKFLIEQIRDLCWSLGYRTHLREKRIKGVSYWRLSISGNLQDIPTRLERKRITPRVIDKDPYVTGISIESIGEGDYYGFVIDGNHRYCLQDGTVTHNTVMALYFIAMRGKQSLVLVPTYYLAKQWAQRIQELTPWTYVILTSKDATIPTDRDITIVVMDLFSCRVLPDELVNNIGHVILDEAHRVGAETYLPILEEIPAMYRTALTATFRRSDGVHKILQYHFGKHFRMESRFPKPKVYAVKTGVEVKGVMSKNRAHSDFLGFLDFNEVPYTETKSAIAFNPVPELRERVEKLIKAKAITKKAYKEIVACINKGSEMAYASLDSYLNENASRRKVAIKIIQECLDAGRTVLFLSKRKDTLRALNKYFAKYNPMLIVAETNTRSEEDEKYLQESCPLILGVTQLAKEGLDIDRLDTLVIHLPMADTEQAIGRISRLHPKKQPPVALYLLDNCAMTYSVFNKAKKFIAINGEYKGDITLKQLKGVL